MSPSELWVVRHGETEWGAAGRHTGRTDVALTPAGRARAVAVGTWLGSHPFALVLTSPMQRARMTAELSGFPGAEPDDDLREWDYGAYEGLTTAEIRADAPGWTIWSGNVPGGETATQVDARVRRVLARSEAAGGDVLVFGHGHALRALVAVALGFAVGDGARFALDMGAIGVVGREHEYRTLRLWNVVPGGRPVSDAD